MELTGRVKNTSERFTLRQADLALTLYDCPVADAALDQCDIIGEDTAPARVLVPPGQVRTFTAVFGFADQAQARGVLVRRQTVVETRATE